MTGNDCERYDYQSTTKQFLKKWHPSLTFLYQNLFVFRASSTRTRYFWLPLDLNIYPKMPREWDPVTGFENLETLFDNDLNLAMIVIMRLISNDELWRSKSSTNIEFVHSAT